MTTKLSSTPRACCPSVKACNYAEETAASPPAGFVPKAQLSASAVLQLVGATD
jgi:hypothetical protein